jgi:hypothetical protein
MGIQSMSGSFFAENLPASTSSKIFSCLHISKVIGFSFVLDSGISCMPKAPATILLGGGTQAGLW